VSHSPMTKLQPFDPRPMFEQVRASLIKLLAGLAPADWDRPTPAGHWRVRDVAGHLLGDDVSRLSRSRDAYKGRGPDEGETLAQFLDNYNEQWVQACARISPSVLQDLLALTSGHVMSYWQHVNLHDMGEPVSWIDQDRPAPVWLDCARDFTEDWIHQEQIRQGVRRERRTDPTVMHAVLDTFMHAMNRTLDQHHLPDGSSLAVRIEPELDTEWSWSCRAGSWFPVTDVPAHPTTLIISDAQTWWGLCVRMLTPAQARDRTQVVGDEQLARAALTIVSIIRDA
jgi:uncharacterized protein (TIGR03083 family)